ncbi:hypothetical protein [Allostreptomyces psammosilenae]|uniref:Uncharacterized protein n=1 Tax=Allostreptomyces psammosilenae TaxID=1892865 RepID=A0A852ZRM2_9ACTN|nr:hypothetical protein [Allostreptomyces psammosilenae]NYI05009.1 hypothetical protein [Allostreptomyces psammosilenae]
MTDRYDDDRRPRPGRRAPATADRIWAGAFAGAALGLVYLWLRSPLADPTSPLMLPLPLLAVGALGAAGMAWRADAVSPERRTLLLVTTALSVLVVPVLLLLLTTVLLAGG